VSIPSEELTGVPTKRAAAIDGDHWRRELMERVVIVGGSLAGRRTAEVLREEGFQADITVVDDDTFPSYDRYHLSKDYLVGLKDEPQIGLPTEHLDVDWRRGRSAVSLDVAERRVWLDDGSQLGYDGLVVASGSSARVPADLDVSIPGVFPLRSLTDAKELRTWLRRRPQSVVVIGGGLIGSEVASVTAAMGLPTTIVDSAPLPLAATLGMTLASTVMNLHEQHAISLRYGVEIRRICGDSTGVTGVELADGTKLPADVVVVSLGVTPNTAWLADSGLVLDDGLVCDAALFAAGTTNVVAAGDVARWTCRAYGDTSLRLEHWRSALDQAACAGRNLLAGGADAQVYSAMPIFGTHIHGFHFRSLGVPRLATTSEVAWGNYGEQRYGVAFYRGPDVVGVIALEDLQPLTEWSQKLKFSPSTGKLF
jgi:NADPH-dependent 2,4-dienoyl-CoA reductase/sulfur reductase-like enzyme